ncbi:MAG: chlorophyll synthase ChlG [Pseudomonadota bacterium]
MSIPPLSAVVELLKPITWFPPMWAFGCGILSIGAPQIDNHWLILLGILLCGPMVCGASQVVNDWFDRHVDRINEPNRPIPSGRVSGRWGLYIAIVWSSLSMLVASGLGTIGLVTAAFGLLLAWAYSAPPVRLKQNGWWGNAAVAACYEGLPWFTGAAIMAAALPDPTILLVALLYSVGAHGIMTLNDFKSIKGDLELGIRSLPAQLGVTRAAQLACVMMAVPQTVVVALLFMWQQPAHAVAVLALLITQLVLMHRFLSDPQKRAIWYSAFGVTLYVLGMLVTAFALRAHTGVT